jgi:hypothetical protein
MVANQGTLIANRARAKGGVRVKTIALPAEHGGWGLLFEPIVLGLLLAPSIPGFYLALSAVGFFLARHPLTLVVLNRRRSSPRTALARRFATLYLVIGAASFIAALAFTQHSFVLPLLVVAPFAILQVAHDWTGRRRVLLSELAGVIAVSSLVTAVALAAGLVPTCRLRTLGGHDCALRSCRSLRACLFAAPEIIKRLTDAGGRGALGSDRGQRSLLLVLM